MLLTFKKRSFFITTIFLFLTGCASGKFNTSHVTKPSVKPQSEINILVSSKKEQSKYTTRANANKDLSKFAKAVVKKFNDNNISVSFANFSVEDQEQARKKLNSSYRYTLALSWSQYSKNSQGGRQLTSAFNLIDNVTKQSVWQSDTTFPVNAFTLPKVSTSLVSELVSLGFIKSQ